MIRRPSQLYMWMVRNGLRQLFTIASSKFPSLADVHDELSIRYINVQRVATRSKEPLCIGRLVKKKLGLDSKKRWSKQDKQRAQELQADYVMRQWGETEPSVNGEDALDTNILSGDMLDGIDLIYARVFEKQGLSWMGADDAHWEEHMVVYREDVMSFLEAEWKKMKDALGEVTPENEDKHDELDNAKARLQWVFDVAAGGYGFLNMPLPTKTMLRDLNILVKRVSEGVKVVSDRPRFCMSTHAYERARGRGLAKEVHPVRTRQHRARVGHLHTRLPRHLRRAVAMLL